MIRTGNGNVAVVMWWNRKKSVRQEECSLYVDGSELVLKWKNQCCAAQEIHHWSLSCHLNVAFNAPSPHPNGNKSLRDKNVGFMNVHLPTSKMPPPQQEAPNFCIHRSFCAMKPFPPSNPVFTADLSSMLSARTQLHCSSMIKTRSDTV